MWNYIITKDKMKKSKIIKIIKFLEKNKVQNAYILWKKFEIKKSAKLPQVKAHSGI